MFRSVHLSHTTKYITNQIEPVEAASAGLSHVETVGTGGTSFNKYLSGHIKETVSAKIK